MKQLAITALFAFAGFGAQAQVSETRESGEFTAIDVQNGIEVVFTQSNDKTLRVESGNAAFLDNIVTQFKGGTLQIYLDGEPSGRTEAMNAKVYVSGSNVTRFCAATGASIKADGTIKIGELNVSLCTGGVFTGVVQAEKCRVRAASGSTFRSVLTATSLRADATSGASLRITGTADYATVSCIGGVLHGGKLVCQKAEVRAGNGGQAYITTTKHIKANADTSSCITYYGEPAEVDLGENTYAIKRDNHKFALN